MAGTGCTPSPRAGRPPPGLPILMINSVLLPGPDALLAPPTRPWGSWDALGLALNDSLLDSDVLAAAGSVLTDMAGLLIDPGRPAERAAIPPDSPTVRRLLRVADELARIARLRALEEAEAAWGAVEPECPKCGGPGWFTEVRSGTPEWSCTSCGHRWAGRPRGQRRGRRVEVKAHRLAPLRKRLPSTLGRRFRVLAVAPQ